MKKLLLVALALSATSAFAQYAGRCEIGLTDRFGNVDRVFRSLDANCYEAMKDCRKEIRMNPRYSVGVNDCVEITRQGPQNPGPIPGPQNPYPNPNPGPQYPGPQTGYDANRALINGESVIMNSTNRYMTVLGASYNGMSYAVRSTDGWNTITQGISRDDLSVTSGCSSDLCVNDSVINVQTARYVNVAGLSTLGRFVTKSTDGWNTLVSGNVRQNLAITKSGSCAFSRFGGQICVGNQVINQQNRYSTVVGIQIDGRVVLKSTDGWNTLTTNVDASNLVITR